MGCGSAPGGRNTKNRGRLTTASSPNVEAMPSLPIDQKSATHSEYRALEARPRDDGPAAPTALADLLTQGLDQPEQRGALVPDLVDE